MYADELPLPRLQATVSVEFCVQTEECILMIVYFIKAKTVLFCVTICVVLGLHI